MMKPEEANLLLHELSALYGINFHAIKLVVDGINTTFLVDADEGYFFLRLYRPVGRPYSEAQFEHQALASFPDTQYVKISRPVKNKQGQSLCFLNYQGESRLAAIFTQAAGQAPGLNADTARLFGSSLACLHDSMAGFEGEPKRRLPDITHYINDIHRSNPAIISDLNKEGELSKLVEIESSFRNRSSRPYAESFCHGDVWIGNIHVDNETVTFFDLDDCGIGAPMYDIGTFAWWMLRTKSDPVLLENFKDSYLRHKRQGDLNFDDLPFFVLKNEIRSLAFLIKYNLLDEDMLKGAIEGAKLILGTYFPSLTS